MPHSDAFRSPYAPQDVRQRRRALGTAAGDGQARRAGAGRGVLAIHLRLIAAHRQRGDSCPASRASRHEAGARALVESTVSLLEADVAELGRSVDQGGPLRATTPGASRAALCLGGTLAQARRARHWLTTDQPALRHSHSGSLGGPSSWAPIVQLAVPASRPPIGAAARSAAPSRDTATTRLGLAPIRITGEE